MAAAETGGPSITLPGFPVESGGAEEEHAALSEKKHSSGRINDRVAHPSFLSKGGIRRICGERASGAEQWYPTSR